MLRRYIMHMLTIDGADGAHELWLGFITDEKFDVSELGEAIPADDMTEDELSIVRQWITI